jgi:uncharacterized protein (TIGR02678 family)
MSSAAASVMTTANPETDAERRSAVRALLRNPLLAAAGDTSKEYDLVRRHSVWLKYWFAKFPMWSLHVDNNVARLRKTPPDFQDETRSAIDATSGSAFSRRRYALFCLSLAALERAERNVTLGQIAEAVMEFVAADSELSAAGFVFDISNHDHRRDLVHAVRFLLRLGLINRLHGDEQQFLSRSSVPDAVYAIDRSLLAVMLNVSRSPSALEAEDGPGRKDPGSLFAVQPPLTEELRNRRTRARLVRTLLDDPILYLSELTGEERVYLERQKSYLLRQIQEATGLIPEVRREGIAMVDDAADVTDIKLPEEGTDGHVSLLLAAWVAEQCRRAPGRVIPLQEVHQYVGALIQAHRSRWRKAVREPGAEAQLAEDALLRLSGLRLVRITSDGVVPLAAVGRYASGSTVETERQE